jgi:hypothetical protein
VSIFVDIVISRKRDARENFPSGASEIYPSGLLFLPLHIWRGVYLLTWPPQATFNMQWSAWSLMFLTGVMEFFIA